MIKFLDEQHVKFSVAIDIYDLLEFWGYEVNKIMEAIDLEIVLAGNYHVEEDVHVLTGRDLLGG